MNIKKGLLILGFVVLAFYLIQKDKDPEVSSENIIVPELKIETLSDSDESENLEAVEGRSEIKSNTLMKVSEPPESNAPQTSEIAIQPEPPTWPEGSVEFEIKEGSYAVSFGDIILGVVPEEKRHLKRAYFEPPKSKLWPSSVIAYSINEETPNKQEILAAIDYFHRETPVRFVPRKDEEESILFMASENLCASQLGRVGGHQVILIASQCKRNEILHELMHSLGFVHEHSREDRDRYLEVVWENIKPEFFLQFQMVPDAWIHEYRGAVFDFDPKSIMLYPPTAFAKSPGLTTLKSKGSPLEPTTEGLSRLDKERVYYLYGH